MTMNTSGPILDRGFREDLREWFRGFPLSKNDPDYIQLFDDFVGVDDDQTNDWTVVKDATAAVDIEDDADSGVLALTSTATTDNDGASIQGNEIFAAAASRVLWFEARVKLHDADDCDMFVGLCENWGTNPEDSVAASNRIGFQIDEGDASILCKSESGDAETSKDSEVDAADATWVKLGFRVIGVNKVEFFINRILVATIETNIPTTLMTPAMSHISGSVTGTFVARLDYILAVQTR